LVGAVVRGLLQGNALVVAPSSWIAEASRELGWRCGQIREIPYAIDLNFWRPLRVKEIERDARSVRLGFGFSGRGASFRKGQDLVYSGLKLIDEQLSSQIFSIQLILFGDSATSEAQFRNIQVEHVGNLDKDGLRELFSSLDFLLLPSRQENLALLALEGQACGVSIIVMNRTGLSSTVSADAQTKFSSPNPRAIANALLDVLNQPERWSSWSQRSRQHAEKTFSPAFVASKYMELFSEQQNN
jgi:glycosyltransferase involved in cell wall biosynthesis